MALPAATAAAKSGCWILQPTASSRPEMVKRSWTPPSRVPSGLDLNLTSRTGPFGVMKSGTILFAPVSVAMAIWGFCAGLLPPTVGCAWQEKQELALNRGPSPTFASLDPVTPSISRANRVFAAKYSV